MENIVYYSSCLQVNIKQNNYVNFMLSAIKHELSTLGCKNWNVKEKIKLATKLLQVKVRTIIRQLTALS